MMMGKLPIRLISASRRLLSTASPAAVESSSLPPPSEVAAAAKDGKKKEKKKKKNNKKQKEKKEGEEENRESGRGGGKPLYRRLSELGGAAEGAVSRTLNKWVKEGRPVKVMDLVNHVKDLRKYRRYKHALEMMDWMVNTRGMNMSWTNHAIRLDLIAKVRGIESAEDYFCSLPETAKNQRTYGALLNCYCLEKMVDKATALYQKMKELNLASNTLVYNNLMALYMKLEQPEKVPALVEEMKANNIAPDNMTNCILMNSYAKLNDIESVEGVIHQMEDSEEVIPHWTAYSTLAGIYNSAGLFKKTESALKKLEGLLDGRERDPFHFLISLYAGAGNLEEVHRVWESLKKAFKKQTNMSYLTMLQALNKLNDFDGFKACYKEWESVLVTYDPRLTNLAIGAHLRNDMVEEAESLSRRATEKGGGPDFRTCDLFMDYYLKKDEMSSALGWLETATRMVKEGGEWKLDGDKIQMFMKYYEKEKDVDGAEAFCKVLKTLDCLGLKAYELLLRTYAASGRRERSLRRRVEEDEIKPTPKIQKLLDIVCGKK
ncbi:pentatricopeptide repeat-containing protein-like, mitochondrial [Iris pallida]|uniref:Pentatricopeptide repeat-containing protein-like, mitochondrial n=1 Tax=Iris pallida TaxID=29817 RepID=A0AAX6EU74_IRIPA|nr:pentatricopeptide repeat-containing protein-like, mitochondrial [Iris pallida]